MSRTSTGSKMESILMTPTTSAEDISKVAEKRTGPAAAVVYTAASQSLKQLRDKLAKAQLPDELPSKGTQKLKKTRILILPMLLLIISKMCFVILSLKSLPNCKQAYNFRNLNN
jgi:rRNA maturation protein Rpf1